MNNEPVAWMGKDYDGLKTELYFDVERNKLPYRLYETATPLYTHSVKKELTDEEIFKLAEMLEIKMNHALYAFARTLIKNAQENLKCYEKLSDASKMASKPISEKSRAILRKVQEK